MFKYKIKFILTGMIMINLLLHTITNAATSYYVNDGWNGTERYCTAAGNDGNNGTTPATPKEHIWNLLGAYSLDTNDIVYIDAGIYNERVLITPDDDGHSGKYVTFKGIASGGTNSVIHGTGAANGSEGCITLNNVKYVKIDSLYLRYSGVNEVRGIYSKNYCTNLLFINNIVVSNQLDGIKLEITYYSTVSNNKC